MKSLLTFVLGLALGILVGRVLIAPKPVVPDPAPIEALQTELAQLKQSLDEQQTELLGKEAEIVELEKSVQAYAGAAGLPEQAAAEDAPANPFMEMTKQVAAEMSANIYTTELVKLQTALDLTPEQAQAVEDFYRSQEDQHTRAMELVMSGMSMEEVHEVLMQEMENKPYQTIDQLLKELLDPAQLQAYETYEATARAEKEEANAYRELSNVQSTINMTETQKDAVFEVLYAKDYKRSSDDWKAEGVDMADPKSFLKIRQIENERLFESLAGILEPEQLEVLQAEKERELKLMEASSAWMQ